MDTYKSYPRVRTEITLILDPQCYIIYINIFLSLVVGNILLGLGITSYLYIQFAIMYIWYVSIPEVTHREISELTCLLGLTLICTPSLSEDDSLP
jgi:hypothetical protein